MGRDSTNVKYLEQKHWLKNQQLFCLNFIYSCFNSASVQADVCPVDQWDSLDCGCHWFLSGDKEGEACERVVLMGVKGRVMNSALFHYSLNEGLSSGNTFQLFVIFDNSILTAIKKKKVHPLHFTMNMHDHVCPQRAYANTCLVLSRYLGQRSMLIQIFCVHQVF